METRIVSIAAVPKLKSNLVAQGFNVYELNTIGVYNQASFFEAALAGLPMGDAIKKTPIDWRFPQNWSAFNDFLWQSITEQQTPVAIVWIGSAELQHNNPELYNSAIDAITDVAVGSSEAENLSLILFLTRSESEPIQK